MLAQYDNATQSHRRCFKVMKQAMRAASRGEVNSTAMKEVRRLLVEQSRDKVLGRLRDVLPGLACEGGLLCQNGLPAPMCVRTHKTIICFTCQNCFSAAGSTFIKQTFTVPGQCRLR